MKKWVKQTLKKALAGTVMCCMLAGMTACSNNPMSFSLGGKKVPYFTSYNFKEQALRNF